MKKNKTQNMFVIEETGDVTESGRGFEE